MAEKILKNGKKYWQDSQGDLIPENYVRKEDKERDKIVENIIADVKKYQKEMQKLKDKIEKETNSYLEKIAEEYGENWKGNARLSTFAGDKAVELSVSEFIDFDEKLQIAKQKIDNCIHRWTKGSDKSLEILVTKAFKTDKKGKLNKKLILQLRTYEIKDKEWQDAMEIINKSIKVVNSKNYFNFYEKSKNGKWTTLSLNFSQM